MPDVVRLQAEAEDAHIRSEMARSRLEEAKSDLLKLAVRWSRAKGRRPIARSVEALDRSRHGTLDI
jgi:predicted metal-dependent hydrolase